MGTDPTTARRPSTYLQRRQFQRLQPRARPVAKLIERISTDTEKLKAENPTRRYPDGPGHHLRSSASTRHHLGSSLLPDRACRRRPAAMPTPEIFRARWSSTWSSNAGGRPALFGVSLLDNRQSEPLLDAAASAPHSSLRGAAAAETDSVDLMTTPAAIERPDNRPSPDGKACWTAQAARAAAA